jgi:hypothetical protein
MLDAYPEFHLIAPYSTLRRPYMPTIVICKQSRRGGAVIKRRLGNNINEIYGVFALGIVLAVLMRGVSCYSTELFALNNDFNSLIRNRNY